MKDEKPLFIPLNTEYYEQFESGEKKVELRQYGPRWNKKTCRVGRAATLSKGYGKKNRMYGHVSSFKKVYGANLSLCDQLAFRNCYGSVGVYVACIGIEFNKL
jgi:hypothetical protein